MGSKMSTHIPKVLFISTTSRIDDPYLDPSVRYRCFNFAEDLRLLGGIADVVSTKKFEAELIENYDHFIFHRPSNSDGKLPAILDSIERKHKSCHADYDDLIFAVNYALESSIYINGVKSKAETIEIFNKNFAAFNLFKSFTASTSPLAKIINTLSLNAKINVVPNGLSQSLLSSLGINKENRGAVKKIELPKRVISYLSGTKSHDIDFSSIQDVLISFLSRHPNFCLLIAGHININEKRFSSDSILVREHMPFKEFFKSVKNAYINIAPLQPDNTFNECKSALKFFESGIWGVPTIATPIPDFTRFTDSPGLQLADKLSDWENNLEKLADKDQYEHATEGLGEYCMKNCVSLKSTEILLKIIGERKQS